MAERVCFTLKIRPERVEEYRRQHARVWPEMLEALTTAGWRNYSLFVAEGGTVIGYFECDDVDAARAAMQATDVNTRWQAEMVPLLDTAGQRADEAMQDHPEIFHLD